MEPTEKQTVVKQGVQGLSGRNRWPRNGRTDLKNRLKSSGHWAEYVDAREQLKKDNPDWDEWEFGVVAAEQFTEAAMEAKKPEGNKRPRGNMSHPDFKPRAGTARKNELPLSETFQHQTMSPRDVLLWVASHMGTAMPEPTECPNAECYGALLNAISAPGDFWKSFYSLARKDDGDVNDPLADDGRKNLEFVDRQIEQFAKDNPELVGKKHKDFTDDMWKEAGQIVSGGEKVTA